MRTNFMFIGIAILASTVGVLADCTALGTAVVRHLPVRYFGLTLTGHFHVNSNAGRSARPVVPPTRPMDHARMELSNHALSIVVSLSNLEGILSG
jgi:hypothetical protein